MPTTPSTPAQNPIDMDDVAEWVGLHYQKNFVAESKEQRADWIARYVEMHAADSDAVGAAAPAKTVKFVVEVRSTSEEGEKPDFAVIDIDQNFLDRASKLVALCAENQLVSVHTWGGPDWGGDDVEDLRLSGEEMVVNRDGSFWFEAYPKHSGYSVETQALTLAGASEKFELAADGEAVFMASNGYFEATLREMYEDSLAVKAQYESAGG